jgi:putative transposase
MRCSASEKMEIIRIVSNSELGVIRTLRELGINKPTFYKWYNRYKKCGFDGLLPKSPDRKYFWNKIPDQQREEVVEFALEHEDLSPRELAVKITDDKGWFISESSVYRILKERGLITSPAWIVMSAANEFKNKTSRPNQMWQNDFTYFKILGWGWFYLSTILDDYSRYIVHWELCEHMKQEDAERVVKDAKIKAGLSPEDIVTVLTDNGPCYIAKDFDEYLDDIGVKHIRGRALHPQTQGKIERYHRSMKNVIKLENYFFPWVLKRKLEEFVDYYNNHRYHESIDNLTPEDVYFGRGKEILKRRMETKTKTLKERKRLNKLAC